MNKQKLKDLLFKDSGSNNLADKIRKAKNLTNPHDNVILYQEKKSLCDTAEKLSKLIKTLDKSAKLTIETKKGKWQD